MYERVLHFLMTLAGILIRDQLNKLEAQGRHDRLEKFFKAADRHAEKAGIKPPAGTT
jgi:hypothetical protein